MNPIALKRIYPTDKQSPDNMTELEWHQYFQALKLLVAPEEEPWMCNEFSDDPTDEEWDCYYQNGEVILQYYYRQFINGVLETIRNGGCDFCHYIYQVADLLRFEHDTLAVDWLPEDSCFKVYLIKSTDKLLQTISE